MITAEQLYRATNDGLDIILMVYPQAQVCLSDRKAKFKCRLGEKTPSAVLWEGKDTSGNRVWKVVDYGDEGHALSPVDCYMKERGVTRFGEAVLQLAQHFDVRDELNRTLNRSEWVERAATADEDEGATVYKLMEKIPTSWLKVLGPKVTHEHAEALHWYAVEEVGVVKNRRIKLERSNDNYPIFMRECVVQRADGSQSAFFKIYKPLNPEKQYRFSYCPKGEKPQRYINGLAELKQIYDTYNEAQERDFFNDPANENKVYKPKKLEEAVICSGERDSLCCKSMGYSPLWFNSETYQVSDSEMREILKYVKVVYNIPDLDSTGRKKGTELALRYPEIRTAWLPEWLSTYRDNRGKPRKDLRDWMELRNDKKDFVGLLSLAAPAQFWREQTNKKSGKVDYYIDTVSLLAFLELNGFHTLKDEESDAPRFIHIEGSTVREVRQRDIRRFMRVWAEERELNSEIRNLILNSPRLAGSAVIEHLSEVDLDFGTYTPTSQLFYFRKTSSQNMSVCVTPTGIEESIESTGHYVWEDNVIPHKYSKLAPMFAISELEAEDSNSVDPVFDIEILDKSSPLFGYLINTSRIHWRKEMEEQWMTHEERAAYAAPHRFCIDGEGLSVAEGKEQKNIRRKKIFAIGYMLHRYKSPSRAWAPQAMDHKIGEDGQCNGRSGKSFLFKAFETFGRMVKLSGRNPKLMDNPHVFDQVDKSTDMILVDDCAQYLSMGIFYDIITGSLTVNPKNNRSYTIPFHEAPKLSFTTNYVPTDFNASTMARLLPLVFSDYYHQRTEENDYLEDRAIRDDFDRNLQDDGYPTEDWNKDINFMLQCLQFYLSLAHRNVKIMPPMDNILTRKHKADMGVNFEDWAETYFSTDGDNLDRLIVRREAFDEYVKFAGNAGRAYSMQRFTKQLKAFAICCHHVHVLNPEALLNSQGRISRRVDGKMEDCFYLRSTKAQEQGCDLNDSFSVVDQSMPF